MARKKVNITDVCSEIFAGGDAPKNRMSIEKTSEYTIPIYSNGEDRDGLYGYTDFARVNFPSITVSARGTIGYTSIRKEPFVPIVRLITITPIPERIDIRYLYYAINNFNFSGSGTSIPQLTVPMIKQYNFPLPPLDEQRRIAAVLDKVSDLIAKRRTQLDKLDELVKSRFIEMFGDPERNPKCWQVVSITEIIGGKVSNDGNVQVLGVANIVNRMYSNLENLPRTNATKTDVEKYGVKYGDMLFCRSSLVAEGIGKASIVPQGASTQILFECHVIRLPLDLRKCAPEFVQVLSTTNFFRQQIIAQSKTATMTTIGQDGILKAMITLPPIELQNQFADFVKQTDKSKLAIQKNLEKLEILRKSLMQKYFD